MLSREACQNIAKLAKPIFINGADKFLCSFCNNETTLEKSLCLVDKRNGAISWCCDGCKVNSNIFKLKPV